MTFIRSTLNLVRALARRVSTCRAARLYPRALTGSHNHTLAVAALMPLSPCRIIAAYNRCASGTSAALPAYPFPRLTLTSGMSQFGPASGSLKETRGHIMTVACKRGLSVYLSHFPPPEKQKPRRVAGLVVSFIWMYVSMIRSIQDTFMQSQLYRAKKCRHML